ncbi:MAG: PBP1A family penicillin-binding protein [Caulobacteraceae bacterium]|nr:PBP1A family penicillin-binding protein [Caulobacteraceae bacterium]
MNERFKTPRKPNDPAPRRFTPVTAPAGTLGRVLRLTAAVVVALALVGAGVAALAIKAFVDATPPLPDKSALMVANQAPGMTFEDHDGKVIATRGPRHGHMIMLTELPPYVPHAFLAAEDRRFYQHGPVDLRGIARALRANLKAGHTVQGGSTLTQQLAKTLFLSPDQTLRRKLQEAVIAWRMERAMSKDEVLALYLNRIFFGDNAYGIDAAAQTYFAKPASGLTIQEAALLAALPKAPTRLALTNDMNAALARSRIILATMKAEGWITPAQEQAALAAPPKLAPDAPGEGDFGYVLDMAAAQAVQLAGGQAPDLVVRLSVDPRLQATAQALVRQTIADEGRRGDFRQGALVLMAPDGAIRALVGGADHHLSAFNRAAQAQRQPGSSFKPFIYAAALENGAKPTDTRQDAPVRVGNWTPTNYGGGYRGAVSLAQALALSINTIAVRLASEVGGGKIGEIAHRFGLKDIPDQPDLSVALGAYEVTLLELTSAYQVFQNGGMRNDPYLVEQIADQRGDVLYAHVPSAGVSVYDAANAAQMVRMMEGVITHGTGARAAFGRTAAGKTGTSQNWRDAWFIGFTPDWICGVWVGNDEGASMYKVTGGEAPADIWRRMMIAAHGDAPVRDFAWMPPPSAATPDQDLEPSGESGLDPAADPKAAFYDDLANDFDKAQGGHAGDDAAGEPPPPDDEAAPYAHTPAPPRYRRAPAAAPDPASPDAPAYQDRPAPAYEQDGRL